MWVLYPESRTVHVMRPGEPVVILGAGDTLSGADVIEGFSVQVTSLFPDE
jgi:hypothetical protein